MLLFLACVCLWFGAGQAVTLKQAAVDGHNDIRLWFGAGQAVTLKQAAVDGHNDIRLWFGAGQAVTLKQAAVDGHNDIRLWFGAGQAVTLKQAAVDGHNDIRLWFGAGQAVTLKQAAVDGHNDIRRQEAKDENAANLYELVWDNALATEAQRWADKCNFEHQHIRGHGENLYYASPNSHADSYYIQRALRNWMSEKSLNDDGSFDCCYHGHYDCCHYTQVVASRTKKVGCAKAHCDVLKRAGHTISHHAALVVCDNEPMGNVAVNGHHAAYSSRDACSGCASGDKCNDFCLQ